MHHEAWQQDCYDNIICRYSPRTMNKTPSGFSKYTHVPRSYFHVHCSRNIFTNQPRVARTVDEDGKVEDMNVFDFAYPDLR